MSSFIETRRAVLAGSAALASSFLLPGAGRAQAQGKPFDGQPIVHWSFLSPEGKSVREQAIKLHEEAFRKETGINVAFEIYPFAELARRLVTAVQANTQPDVTRVGWESIPMVSKAGALSPLDAYIEKAFDAEQRKDFLIDYSPALLTNGQKTTMQLETISHALFVRKDWLERAGMKPPRTWSDVVEFGKKVSGDGRWGYGFFGGKQQLVHAVYLQPHIHGRGGRILGDDGKATFTDDAAVRAYKFLSDCVHVHKITPPDVVNMSWEDQTDAFRTGKLAMFIDGSHRYRDHARAVGADNILLVEIPSDDPAKPSPTPLTGWSMGIPKGAKTPDAAWQYIQFYLRPEVQAANARIAGALPSRRSAAGDPYFKTPEAAYLQWWLDYTAANSEPMINVPTASRLTEAMVDALHEVILKPNSDIAAVLRRAAAGYDRVAQQQ
ncbi:hypothetical protein ASE63_21930 [Bosea sp. Root381]|uniref:ABC transporter substrate-binding protein n=1 Tax=Bosea sp. Root381 TaxID=1736524 RepID=UPI000715835F|nr:sugar ABC transporter substrate-binding protein [Bosea sp. Root381]KRE07995.1 hypothetical protein ASE63_21930 [Bosea sp. Root381]